MNKRYLGVMLDCSRNAVMSVSSLKDFILDLEKLGYNCLQLYTEDTYEIEEEPLFGYMRGRYTKAELKEIDEFAELHGIELMPCIQTLAHLNQIFVHAKYVREVRDVDDILLVGEERTYELIDRMFATLSESIKSRNIHIGMDEAWLLGCGKYLRNNGYVERPKILLEHLNRVCSIAEKYGYNPMMWSDMFFRMAWGRYTGKGEIPTEVIEKVPENVKLVYWNYDDEEVQPYMDMMESHFKFNREVWFAGGAWKWNGFGVGFDKTFDAMKPAIRACKEAGVNNILVTMWGDNGNECPAKACLPSLTYIAECAKGNYDLENARQKFEELFGESWDDFMLLGLPLPESLPKQHKAATGVKEMLYNDCFLGMYDYACFGDGRESKGFGDLAKKFRKAKNRSKKYDYIFESYEKLCQVMQLKYDLGYRTRVAYMQKDVEQLSVIVNDYGTLIRRVQAFIK